MVQRLDATVWLIDSKNMFTGIIQALGTIARIEKSQDSARIAISGTQLDLSDVQLGDSIAVSGPCLTVVNFSADEFVVDVSAETLARTTIGKKSIGESVNLEKALRLSDRLGGHLVSGHVDGIGTVTECAVLENYVQFRIEAPMELAKYIATKGSVSIDGVSLTVNAVGNNDFDLMIIPHTLKETTIGDLKRGHYVNLEMDLIARYLERLSNHAETNEPEGLTAESLHRAGFLEQ